MNNSIIDVPGIRVGHAHDEEALTGCTVVLCEAGAVGGVDQRGGAPGTRETDTLYPMRLIQKVHAITLAGGSAFGLDAAGGVVKYLEERGIGFDVGVVRVPIVPSAIIFDLSIGRSDVRPDATMGYQACLNASDALLEEGNFGAGCGATVGKILGIRNAMKAGIGSSSITLAGDVVVGAIAVVNAFGDVINSRDQSILAGALRNPISPGRRIQASDFADTLEVMRYLISNQISFNSQENTVIGVVATNAALNKEQVNKVAQMAHDGLARAIRPAHTMVDGDTIFALSLGDKVVDVNVVGSFAAQVFEEAIHRGVMLAKPAGGLPAYQSE